MSSSTRARTFDDAAKVVPRGRATSSAGRRSISISLICAEAFVFVVDIVDSPLVECDDYATSQRNGSFPTDGYFGADQQRRCVSWPISRGSMKVNGDVPKTRAARGR
jgi:hypothetical protein